MSRTPVGLVGIGLLGSALGERLIEGGFPIVGFDQDRLRLEDFATSGGRCASSVIEMAEQCTRIVLSLPDAEVSTRVARELATRLAPQCIIVDTTTGDPNLMQQLGDELARCGIGYLDATVAGSSAQARTGDVLMLIGGDPIVVENCRDLFEAISPQSIHVGPCGSGARMKLVVNLVLGLNRAVLAEGLSFARTMGIAPQTALDALERSPAQSAVMTSKGRKMVTGDFTPQARLRQHLKDVHLILGAGSQSALPLSVLHAQLLQSLVDRGFGDEDNSAIIRAFPG